MPAERHGYPLYRDMMLAVRASAVNVSFRVSYGPALKPVALTSNPLYICHIS